MVVVLIVIIVGIELMRRRRFPWMFVGGVLMFISATPAVIGNGSADTSRGTPGTVSQWQKGEFEVVWPPKLATAKLNAAKAAWK